MDKKILDQLERITAHLLQASDFKKALDSAIVALREIFVYDNLAIYLLDEESKNPEIIYARAVGRGRAAEADADWGLGIASLVADKGEQLLQSPDGVDPLEDRVRQPYLLGIPLRSVDGLTGVVAFVRFGGPEYREDQVRLASMFSIQVGALVEKNILSGKVARFEETELQMRLQDDFIATISHDLRTPLGFIKGYTTTLLRPDTEWDLNTQREFLAIIDEEADRLTALIDHILESARLQSHTLQMNYQPMRLDALIRDATMRARAHQKNLNVELDLDPPPPIEADGVHLAQVFENLYGNAMKYAPNSRILVTLRQVGKNLRVTFSDTGPGIPIEHLPYIFERFYRVPETSNNKPGTGLGLYICKQIITAHQGNISVESSPGKGTRFYIDLPLEQSGG